MYEVQKRTNYSYQYLRVLACFTVLVNQVLSSSKEHKVKSELMKKKLPGLNLFRIFLMVWILLFHGCIHYAFTTQSVSLNQIISIGAVGCTGFFMVSGFVLRYNYGKKLTADDGMNQDKSLKRYMLQRIAGIYPVYIFMTTMALLTGFNVPGSLRQLLMFLPISLSLLQTFDHQNTIYFLYNDNCWYLATAFVLYLLFPLVNKVINWVVKTHGCKTIIVYFLILAIISEYFYTLNIFYMGNQFLTYYAHPILRLPEFAAGMLLSDLYQKIPKKYAKWNWIGLLLGLTFLFAGILGLYPRFTTLYNMYNIILLPAFGLIIISLCCAKEGSFLQKLSANPVIAYGSQLTFACYLAQSFSVQLLNYLLYSGSIQHIQIVQKAFFALTVFFAMIMHHMIELPGKFLCKKMIDRYYPDL